ncbi:MAG: cyclic nucleotide-binding domain-containing protein [Thermodesulfobacteriota bacterium]
MEWTDFIGYLAAAFMFSTFYMSRMIPLRAAGITANITFITYASIAHVYPLLILHIVLLPLNTFRMIQMIRLVNSVRESSKGDFSMDFLVPFMHKESFKKGAVVFTKGADADKMYYLQKGLVKLKEFDVTLKEGDLLGEIAIFSPDKERTATAVCEEDTEFLAIHEKHVLQLYYQNPKFGFYLVQLIIFRLLKNAKLGEK